MEPTDIPTRQILVRTARRPRGWLPVLACNHSAVFHTEQCFLQLSQTNKFFFPGTLVALPRDGLIGLTCGRGMGILAIWQSCNRAMLGE